MKLPYPSLVDYDDEDATLLDVSPLLRSLALSSLSLHGMDVNDCELIALALLPGLTALNVPDCRRSIFFSYSSITAAGLLAAREAAPHLNLTCG